MQRLFDVKKTQIQMVRDRGYIIPEDELKLLSGSLRNFVTHITLMNGQGNFTARGSLTRIYHNDNNGLMLVYYGNLTGGKQISIEEIRKYEAIINDLRIKEEQGDKTLNESILIVDHPISSTANNHINNDINLKVKNQIFQDSDICYNPTHHILVPIHIKLTEEQKSEKLRELMVDVNKLPIMLNTDPIARYYGWTTGDLIKIVRIDTSVSILAPTSINYRIIVG